MRLAIGNARLVTPEGVRTGGVLVEDGVITALGDTPLPADATDARGNHLAPAIVDLGVFTVDRAACRAGGVVRVAPMPDQSPVLDEPGAVQRLSLIGKPDLWIHPIAAATRGLQGQDLAEMAICRAAGARAVGTGAGWIADSRVMASVLAYARDLDLAVIAHAEDGGLAAHAVATAGETATRLGLPAAPALAEPLAIARDLMLAEHTGARLHFRQVTTAAGFALIRAAKARGVRVTCGITPAHLLLSDIAVSDFRTFAHLSPPLRSEADRQAARAAVADGTVDVLCSGHAPRGPEAKRLPAAIGAMGVAAFTDFDRALDGADVVMMLRLQTERMDGGYVPSAREYRLGWGLTAERLARLPDALVMHPGPMNRGVEIDSTVADHLQSAITEQVAMGVAVRMACLDVLTRRARAVEGWA